MTDYYQQMADNGQIKQHQVNALSKAHEGKPLAHLNGDPTPIIDRLNQGESAMQIAQSLEVSHQALYAWLLRHCPEEWQHLQAARQLARLDECEKSMDDINPFDEEDGQGYTSERARRDNVAITRVRETARMAQWHLERANRKLFGNQEVSVNVGVGIQVTHEIVDSGVTINSSDDVSE